MAGGEHELNAAFHSDDRKDTDGNIHIVHADTVHEGAVEAAADWFGYGFDAHTAVAESACALHDLAIQADRRGNLRNNGGKRGFAVAAKIAVVEAEAVVFRIGGEHRNILFAAVKYYLLIKGAKPLDLLHSAAADAAFECHAEIVSDRDLIKSAIERNRFDVYVGVYHLYIFTPDRACAIHDLLRNIAKVNAKILKAILIPAGIEYFIYTDTAKLFRSAASAGNAGTADSPAARFAAAARSIADSVRRDTGKPAYGIPAFESCKVYVKEFSFTEPKDFRESIDFNETAISKSNSEHNGK